MFQWLQRLRGRPVEIGVVAWKTAMASSPLFQRLDRAADYRLCALAGRFLAHKTFSAAGGHELDDAQCLVIAALACLPVLHIGFDALSGWREVIVYPGEFRVRREHHDEHSGVVTEGEDELIGEAWDRGPVILSWADIATDLAKPFDGFNVVAHEIAHKLDMTDGAMNGVPALPRAVPRREWIERMQSAYDALLRDVERGRDTLIDPYAAESADEFFAVVSELHFSDPATLREAMPAVAGLLERYYGPSPAG